MHALAGISYAAILGLLISFTPTVGGIWFALRPNERRLSFMRPLTLAGIFAAFCTGALGVTSGARALSYQRDFSPQMFWGSLSEVFAAVALSCVFLSVAWICVAIGMRRQGAA